MCHCKIFGSCPKLCLFSPVKLGLLCKNSSVCFHGYYCTFDFTTWNIGYGNVWNRGYCDECVGEDGTLRGIEDCESAIMTIQGIDECKSVCYG